MPIYDYRCPKGHVFERFQHMTDPPPEACEVCGAGPVETVLYPVPVHFKGSGFYSTDYGRAKRKSGDGDASSSSPSSDSDSSSPGTKDSESSNVTRVDKPAASS